MVGSYRVLEYTGVEVDVLVFSPKFILQVLIMVSLIEKSGEALCGYDPSAKTFGGIIEPLFFLSDEQFY